MLLSICHFRTMREEVESPWKEHSNTDLAANLVSNSKHEADIINELVDKKWCIIQVWAPLELKMIKNVVDPGELKENMKANLSTVAIIGALFGGTNLSSFMAANVVDVNDMNIIDQIIVFARFLSAACGLLTAVYSAIIMSMLNAIPKVL